MNHTPRLKFTVKRVVLLFVALVFTAGCSFPTRESAHSGSQTAKADCHTPGDGDRRKVALEHGIRGQVRFVDTPEQLSTIRDKMSEYKIPALSLAVIEAGEIAWADLYRDTTLSKGHQLDCNSIFQAASLSKPVTFLAALRMQDAGAIDLDEDIQKYLKSFNLPEGEQTADNPVTFRNIFAHTSGITPGGYQGYLKEVPFPSDQDVLKGAEGVNSPAISVVSPPNELLAYSGGGYTLAEVALQDHFGKEFSEIMKEWILDPVGMKHSEFTQPLPESEYERVAKGHTANGEMIAGGWHNHPEQAAAGLWSNAGDMAKFLIELYKGYQGESEVFSKEDILKILKEERDGLVYGFIINRNGDDLAVTHYGGNAGYRTGMTISLTTGKGLVYLSNSDSGGALGNELLLSASRIYGWKHFEQISFEQTQVEPMVLKGLEGRYLWDDQVALSVALDDNEGRIALFFPNGDAYKLTPVVGEDLDFVHPGTGVTVAFKKDDDHRSFTLYGRTAVKLDSL
ncbi:serine hydrolase domain-containing protein [Robertkochia sediminum]|uniref:serine hydrolase domain-containing protein n=1 Tax=Robertkochia sediminum TaxID=2785326 RepID=UPI0021D14135|nr:serine hydrolase domain-containing protein [Robertkochia sediminum]MBL7472026.1 beta-lactamase family protein [Robertkochia sediminum]